MIVPPVFTSPLCSTDSFALPYTRSIRAKTPSNEPFSRCFFSAWAMVFSRMVAVGLSYAALSWSKSMLISTLIASITSLCLYPCSLSVDTHFLGRPLGLPDTPLGNGLLFGIGFFFTADLWLFSIWPPV